VSICAGGQNILILPYIWVVFIEGIPA